MNGGRETRIVEKILSMPKKVNYFIEKNYVIDDVIYISIIELLYIN